MTTPVSHPHDPLHGITLENIVTVSVETMKVVKGLPLLKEQK
jgi:hypothetical protein